jgi:hypothetical protein
VTGPPVGNPHTPPRPRVFVGNVVVKNAPRTPTRPPTMQPPPGQSCFAFIDRIAREGSQTYECFGGSSTFAATKEAAAASVLTGFKPITGVGGALTRLCLVNVNDLLGKVREPTTGLPYTCPGLQTLDTGICNRFAVGTLMGANFFGDCGPGSLPGACSLPFAQCPVQGGTVCCKAGEMCTPDGCKAP